MKHSMKYFCAIALCSVAAVLSGVSPAYADKGGANSGNTSTEIRLQTSLAGAAIGGQRPQGSAEFRSRTSRSSFRVEVEKVNLPAGTVLTVALNHNGANATAGTITLNAFGHGELDLNSQDGDLVPAVQAADIVTVLNAGAAILAGAF